MAEHNPRFAEEFFAEHDIPAADIPALVAKLPPGPIEMWELVDVWEKHTGGSMSGNWPRKPLPQRKWDTEAELIAQARRDRELHSDDPSESMRGFARRSINDLVGGLRLLDITPPERAADLDERASLQTCLGALDAIIREAEARGTAVAGTSKPPGEVEYLGDGLYECDGQPFRLEGQERFVMEALVDFRAATKQQLADKSLVDDAAAVLRKVCRKLPQLAAHVHLPGKKGSGGYCTTIRRREPE